MADFVSGANNDPFAVTGQDTTGTRKQIAQYAIMQAAAYMQNNQNDQAIGAFKKALAFDPQSATAYNYMGQIYLSQGKNADAIKAYQQLVRIQSNLSLADTSSNTPTQADAHVSLGNAYLQDKQYTASEKEFKTAAKLDPSNPLPPYTLGLQYANTNRLSEAETQLLKVKKISPNDGNVFYALGMVYNKQGRYDDAVTSLEKSLTLKKGLTAANYELGVAYDALGRTADAQNQLSILQSSSDTTNAQNLKTILTKTGISYMGTKNSGGFVFNADATVELSFLDSALPAAQPLHQAFGSKAFSITIGFTNDMDQASVTNTNNWSISRANSGAAGFYNYTRPRFMVSPTWTTAALPDAPESVTYNSTTREATLTFRLNQNSSGTAVIDPKHIVFSFSGKDALGRAIDTSADQIDLNNSAPF
ncbi:MAG: tetratricopeptide repeat protein [Geobacteraceae bacterium]|nr:tetratricopeptide repeat protein [Geobacteraceae bacterium]